MAKMAECALSSPERRALEAIMNVSAQLYSMRSTMNGDGVHWVKIEGGYQKRRTSSLIKVSEAS